MEWKARLLQVQHELELLPGYSLLSPSYIPVLKMLSDERVDDFALGAMVMSMQADFEAERSSVVRIMDYCPVRVLGNMYGIDSAYAIYQSMKNKPSYNPVHFVEFLHNPDWSEFYDSDVLWRTKRK
jgi:hypothetical protein